MFLNSNVCLPVNTRFLNSNIGLIESTMFLNSNVCLLVYERIFSIVSSFLILIVFLSIVSRSWDFFNNTGAERYGKASL